MLQNADEAAAKLAEKHESIKQGWEMLKGLSFDDAISQIANSFVHFFFKLAIAIVVFYVGRFIIRKLNRFLKSIFVNRKVDPSLSTFAISLVQVLLYFILIITVVGILGIETSSFLALFASAGVAIGMALSGTLQNFAGGVLILLLKPYKVGDYIEAQGFAGTVKEIQMFFTLITTPDNKAILIPNGGLSTSSINNYSREPRRRVDWTVGMSYGDDFETAKVAILEILDSDSRILHEEGMAPFVAIKELADSSVSLTVRGWVDGADYWPVFFDLQERFYKELPSKGVNFPFPQLDVHLDKSEG